MIGELSSKYGFTTTLVIFLVIIKFIRVQTGLINNIFGWAFCVQWACVFLNRVLLCLV